MKTIEFISNPEMSVLRTAPTRNTTFEDLVLKPPYRQRLLRFTAQSTWIRPVPPVKGTAYAWMMRLRIHEYPGGRCLHARAFESSAFSPFDSAYRWMLAHHPSKMYTRANPTGIRLLTRDMVLGWVVVDEGERPVPKLLLGSAWNGGQTGEPGLGHAVWTAARQYDDEKQLKIDTLDPEAGYRICVERFRPAGTNRPSYSVQVGRTPAPMAPIMAAMDESYREGLVRIEDVIERPTETQQWHCLEKALGSELYAEFRSFHANLG